MTSDPALTTSVNQLFPCTSDEPLRSSPEPNKLRGRRLFSASARWPWQSAGRVVDPLNVCVVRYPIATGRG